jgi:tellurite resistance protein TehA-like permease
MENNTYPSNTARSNPHPSDLWSGGLIAIGIIILQDFFYLSPLDSAAYTSIFAFAIAIPILTCNLLMNFRRRGSNETATIPEILFYFVGIFAAIIGIMAAFWHVCWIAAVVFFVSTTAAFIVYYKLTH